MQVFRRKKLSKKVFFVVAISEMVGDDETAVELLTWVCPSGTHGLVYRVQPIIGWISISTRILTWRRRRKVLIRIRLGHL
jgi:hypothetical protein